MKLIRSYLRKPLESIGNTLESKDVGSPSTSLKSMLAWLIQTGHGARDVDSHFGNERKNKDAGPASTQEIRAGKLAHLERGKLLAAFYIALWILLKLLVALAKHSANSRKPIQKQQLPFHQIPCHQAPAQINM